MIKHEAMPNYCNIGEALAQDAAEKAFRSLVKWMKEHNYSLDGGLRLSKNNWHSLLKAVKESQND